MEKSIYFYDYDRVWECLLHNANKEVSPCLFHGAFVSYDDSPRRGVKRSRILVGNTPEKFKKYLGELIRISEYQGKEYVFLTAWNEWSEGAFMEPDKENEYAYLEALKEAIKVREITS